MSWQPIWALPNIELDHPVETEYFVLAPHDDARVLEMARQHPEFRKFMRKFTDVHKRRINPTLIIRREDAPADIQTLDAVASFRDILAVSAVTQAWSYNLYFNNHRSRPSMSSYFWVYPWMIDRNFEYVIAYTPVSISLHEASAINAQSSPELFPIRIRREDFDEPLLQALINRWVERYLQPNPTWRNIALFRSLNITYQACQYPTNTDATIFDYGRVVSLWVSAFETLVHPGENGRATLKRVYNLLEDVPWLDQRCGHRRFMTRAGNKKDRRNIACWIYNQLYVCRNTFLHGNPLDASHFMIRRSNRPLINVVPSLYRLGLTTFLKLSTTGEPPPESDTDAFAKFHTDRWEFNQPQSYAERAIRLALISEEEQERISQELVAKARVRTREIKKSLSEGEK